MNSNFGNFPANTKSGFCMKFRDGRDKVLDLCFAAARTRKHSMFAYPNVFCVVAEFPAKKVVVVRG